MAKTVTQVKFTIDSDIVSAFKARCAGEGVSMTSVIRRFMITCHPAKDVKIKTSARLLRKKAVIEIIDSLNKILELETEYRDKIPEQFEQRYETADQACVQLEEAISCLDGAF